MTFTVTINIFKCFIIFIFIIAYKSEIIDKMIFIHKIQKKFFNDGRVNIVNECINNNSPNFEKNNCTINIVFTLDPGYILQTMVTLANIMATQHKTTKIIFHSEVIIEKAYLSGL